MQTYVVRRHGVASTAAELDAALTRLRAFEESPGALIARWIRSYALREPDGRFGLACVFQADGVRALEQHAERTGVAAQAILPVVATAVMRPFAPTMVYLVRRHQFGSAAAGRGQHGPAAHHVDDDAPTARSVRWLRTYAVQDADGSLGTVCIYRSADAATLSEHIACIGTPAAEITPVIGRIVFREDPPLRSSIAMAA